MRQSKIFDDQYIVITGAAGFIGSCVVRYLNDQGYNNLLLIDNLECSEKWKNLVGKKVVDIIPKEQLFLWLEGRENEIEAFLHLGACTDTTETNADYLLENNYRFSIRLAEYALKNDHRFIYASSAATYGDGSLGFSDDHDMLEQLYPLNMYAFSKHLFDLWVKKENLLDKIIGLKYFNVFGPNEYHKGKMSSMVLKMFEQVKKEGKIYLFKSTDAKYKDGEQKRDFIYVKDAVKMTCTLLDDAFKNKGGIFNIARGEAVTWNTLAKAVIKALQQEVHIEYIDMPKELQNQYQNYTCADMKKYDKLHEETGNIYKKTSIEDSVKEYVQEYLIKNEKW